MTENDPILATEDLTKDFSGLRAVDNVTWSVNKGNTVGILGPNGAGKSTFFNLISGVLTPSSGKIHFKGENVTGASAHTLAQKGIIKTFQTTNLFSDLSVIENVRIAAQTTETTFNMFSQAENLTGVDETARDIINRFGLEPIETEVTEELSHGDQRRVEIAVALATGPEVILLDEPTAGVAEGEMDMLRDIFSDIKQDPKYTLIVTEHNIDFILELAQSLTVLHEGRVLAEGPPKEIIQNEDVQRVYVS